MRGELYAGMVAETKYTTYCAHKKKLLSACVWWRREEMMTCGATDVFDMVCGIRIVSSWVASELFIDIVEALREGRRVWGGSGRCVYKLLAGDGDRRRDVKWQMCLISFVMCAF